jgi:hypothetical protein
MFYCLKIIIINDVILGWNTIPHSRYFKKIQNSVELFDLKKIIRQLKLIYDNSIPKLFIRFRQR